MCCQRRSTGVREVKGKCGCQRKPQRAWQRRLEKSRRLASIDGHSHKKARPQLLLRGNKTNDYNNGALLPGVALRAAFRVNPSITAQGSCVRILKL